MTFESVADKIIDITECPTWRGDPFKTYRKENNWEWDDWRGHVPAIVVENWDRLSEVNRITVFLTAHAMTIWQDPRTK